MNRQSVIDNAGPRAVIDNAGPRAAMKAGPQAASPEAGRTCAGRNDNVLRRILESHQLERVAGEQWGCAAVGCAWRAVDQGDGRTLHADHVVNVILEAFTVRTLEQLGAMPDGACLVETHGTVLVKGKDGRYHDTDEMGLGIEGWRQNCVELPMLCLPWIWRPDTEGAPRAIPISFRC